jgi:hypothetical protein
MNYLDAERTRYQNQDRYTRDSPDSYRDIGELFRLNAIQCNIIQQIIINNLM